jgi:hypothetical protein
MNYLLSCSILELKCFYSSVSILFFSSILLSYRSYWSDLCFKIWSASISLTLVFFKSWTVFETYSESSKVLDNSIWLLLTYLSSITRVKSSLTFARVKTLYCSLVFISSCKYYSFCSSTLSLILVAISRSLLLLASSFCDRLNSFWSYYLWRSSSEHLSFSCLFSTSNLSDFDFSSWCAYLNWVRSFCSYSLTLLWDSSSLWLNSWVLANSLSNL